MSAIHLEARILRRIATAALLLAAAPPAAAQVTVRLTSVPANTPNGASIYIAGSFNNWNPAAPGFQLTPRGEEYSITLPAFVHGNLEFKFTLGSWESVETAAAGSDVPNRTFLAPADGPATYAGAVAAWRRGPRPTPAHSAGPTVSVLSADFAIPQLGRTRRVWIYLPADYAASDKRYPVLYMHDGQNVFDDATAFTGEWGVDETLDSLRVAGDGGVIVVAVDHGGDLRLREYSPWVNARYGGGEGAAYADFLVSTLKPYIDAHYRTRPGRASTGVAGSSMGGLISLYAALRYPEVFGRAAMFSPALWFAPEIYRVAREATPRPDTRFYFVTGALEGSDPREQIDGQRMMVDTLAAAGFRLDEQVVAVIRPDGHHTESFWRREFPAAYRWLFRDPRE